MEKEEFQGYQNKEYVPVVKDESADFLFNFCKTHKPEKILEIGTLIGYSGSLMLSAYDNSFLDTVEIVEQNCLDAASNFEKNGFSERVNVINGDAKDIIIKLEEEQKLYDLIFLDGAKGQYKRYLPHLKNLLKQGGYLIADNVYFHGLVKKEGFIEHKHRTIVNNLREFLSMITNDNELESEVLEIGDGISISKKI